MPILKEKHATKITSLEWIPADANAELMEKIEKILPFKGTQFTPRTISSIYQWFARNQVRGVRGLSIEATREGDLRGVALKVRVTPGVYPKTKNRSWQKYCSVSVNGERRASSSGGFSAVFAEGELSKMDKSIEQALKAPLDASFVINSSFRAD